MSCAASTQPGDGAVTRVVVGPPSWKERVVGYAKKFRGSMLRQVRVEDQSFSSSCSDFRGP